jgi:dTDP-glucose 4,6-dehydratase
LKHRVGSKGPVQAFAPATVLVTGGAGFIGSNFVRWALSGDPRVRIANLDLLTYAGNLESLADVDQRYGGPGEGRYTFVHGDTRDFDAVRRVLRGADAVVHFAAESHVDRSILGPEIFGTPTSRVRSRCWKPAGPSWRSTPDHFGWCT